MKRSAGKIITIAVFFSMVLSIFGAAQAATLRIPEGTKVIEEEAFYGDKSIDEVVLPEGIKEIGPRAFSESSLRKINLPSSLDEDRIADDAIDLGVEVTAEEGSEAYWWAVEIGLIEPEDTTELFVFSDNNDGRTCTVTGLKNPELTQQDLIIPKYSPDDRLVTRIGDNAFAARATVNEDNSVTYSTSIMGQLSLPDSIEYIGDRAFAFCYRLTGDLKIPNSVKEIGESAFDNCFGFRGSLSIGTSTVKIGKKAFYYCRYLTGNIIIPDSVKEIGEQAFYYCQGFSGNLIIGNGVKTIGKDAFYDCRHLTGDIIIPDSVTEIGESAFGSCGGLSGHLVIGNSVETIGKRAFGDCNGLTALTIGRSVITIGELAFYNCKGLAGSIVIPENVKQIEHGTFEMCSNVSQISFENALDYIGKYAFYGCAGLESIRIPEGVTQLLPYTFNGCKKLSKIYMPSSIRNIDKKAFGTYSDKITPTIYEGNEYVRQWCEENYLSYNDGVIDYKPRIRNVNHRVCHYVDDDGKDVYYLHLTWDCDYAQYPRNINLSGCENLQIYYNSVNNKENAVQLRAFGGGGNGDNGYSFSMGVDLNSEYITNGLWDGEGGYIWIDVDNGVGSDSHRIALEIIECKNAEEAGVRFTALDDGTCRLDYQSTEYSSTGRTTLTGTFYVPEKDEVSGRPVSVVYLYNEQITNLFIPEGVRSIGINSGCSNLKTIILPRSLDSYSVSFDELPNLEKIYLYSDHPLWRFLEQQGLADKLIARNKDDDPSTLVNPDTPDATSPEITSATITQDTITVGTDLEFNVSASNAWKIQLIVDNEYLDEYWLEDQSIHAYRKITLAGDRKIAFRAYGPAGWSKPYEVATVHVVSDGTLPAPVASWKNKIYQGENLTLTWNEVTNADGYRIYLNHPNGAIDRIEPQDMGDAYIRGSATSPYTYIFPASTFDATGNWSVRLMAYGKGYSQSSALCSFEVTDQYKPWEGWAQSETVPAYDTAYSTSSNGHYVDYTEAVTVKDETDNGRYLVTYNLTAGGTATRYVDKEDIGTEPYSPTVTLSASYFYKDNVLYVSAVTNLVAKRAGLRNASGVQIGSIAYEPSAMVSTYRKAYYFSLPVPQSTVSYTVWASDGNTEKTKVLTIAPPASETPTPEPTETPDYVIVTNSPTPTPTPTPTPQLPSEVLPVNPSAQESEIPAGCMDEHGNHITDTWTFDDFTIVADVNGVGVTSGVCKTCGKTVDLDVYGLEIGFVLDNILLYKYYHNADSGYSLDGISVKSVTFKTDLEISKDTDLQGATLYVEGKLTVKGNLSNVKEIHCQGLQVENGASVTVKNAIHSSKSVDLKEGSSVTIVSSNSNQYGIFADNQDISVNGTISASLCTITGRNITFGQNASAAGLRSCTIMCGKDLTIKGSQFQFNGTVHIHGHVKMSNQDVNYINHLVLDEPILKLNYSNKAAYNYDPTKNEAKINSITYKTFDDAATTYARNQIFAGIRSWLGDQFTGGNTFYQVYQDLKSLIDFVKDENGNVDEEKLGLALAGSTTTGKSVETVAEEWNATVGVSLNNSSDADARTFYNKNSVKVRNAVKYALINDMFLVNNTHSISDAGWTISFPKIVNLGEQTMSCYGEVWKITLDNVMGMTVSVTVDENMKSLPVATFTGTITHDASGASMTWNLTPSNFHQMYSALMACGFSSIKNQLEKAAKSVIGEWTKLAEDVDGFDLKLGDKFWEKVDQRADSFFERKLFVTDYCRLVSIQKAGATASTIIEDLHDEMDAFNFFKDMYEHVKNLRKNTIKIQ